MIKPKENEHRIMISSPSHLVGSYSRDDFFIDHIFPLNDNISFQQSTFENPYCRNYYVIGFETDPPQNGKPVPYYQPFGDIMCIYLSILFGKRFDNHGLMESMGNFTMPRNLSPPPISIPHFPWNNHKIRFDTKIELKFQNISLIKDLIFVDNYTFAHNILITAGKYYLNALRLFEDDIELSYVNLVTCGEVLSNYYDDYDYEQLYDDEAKDIFAIIDREIDDSEKIKSFIIKRIYQVKRKFFLTLTRLINNNFFIDNEQNSQKYIINKEDFNNNIKSAYDLRSKYLHTGQSFGNRIMTNPKLFNELTIPIPEDLVKDREFEKIIMKSPTITGLERIMRYCLLRFIHKEITPVTEVFDDD